MKLKKCESCIHNKFISSHSPVQVCKRKTKKCSFKKRKKFEEME